MVKIMVGNIYSKIIGFIPPPVQESLDRTLSYKMMGARFMPQVKNKAWDGVVRLYYANKGQSFYTGLLAFVRDILKKNNIEYEIIDQRIKPEQNMSNLIFTPPPWYDERDYQAFTIERSMKFTRGILSMCTGSGKTLTVVKMISQIKTYPFIFYVLTVDLMEQAHGVLSMCLNEPIGKIGDGNCDIRKINVCTIQTAVQALNADNKKFNINDYKFDDEDVWDEKAIDSIEKAEAIRKLIRSAQGIYFDETHHAAARTCKDVLSASPNSFWRFGGSGTVSREDGAEIMIQAMFGSKVVDVSASYLIKRGFLVRPYIFFEQIDSAQNFHSYKKIYENCISKNEKFNKHVAETAAHLVQRGLSVLILVQHYPQGDFIKSLLPDVQFVTSRMTSQQRKDAIQSLRSGAAKCLIGTSLLDEGVDVPELDAVLLAGGGKSYNRVHQRIGRTLRTNKNKTKDKAIVVVYEHNAKFLDKHAYRLRRILKKESEFRILDSKGEDFIKYEIDNIIGIDSKPPSIFDS
jgi:superfamily II DNA or RNA helicase